MRRSLAGFLSASALVASLALLPTVASADQIFVQNSGTSAAGGDPNLITAPSTGFVVGVDGSATLEDPLLLVIGVYDGTSSSTAPTVTALTAGLTVTNPAPSGLYGSTANKASFTSGDAFDALGLASGGSEQFDNWACGKNGCPGTGGDIGLGLAKPTSFELFTYEISGAELAGTPFSLTETGAPKGSYIIAYDCKDDTATGTGGACDKNGDIAQTVYTNSGLISPGGGSSGSGSVPEPSALLAMATGLLGLGYLLRRRR